MEITVHIDAPELSHAILELAGALTMVVSAEAGKAVLARQTTQATAQQAAQQAPAQTVTPSFAQQTAQQAPAQQNAPLQAAVGGGAPVYPPLQLAPQPGVPVAAPPVAANPTVPTAAATFSMDQLAVAATQLVDQGRRLELVGLLNSFGVQALTELPKEHYGAFATQLRAMGARL